MRVEIVEISKNDSSYHRKNDLIGEKGTFLTQYSRSSGQPWPVGFDGGRFFFDSGIEGGEFTFHQVKTKPIYDDCG